jgi:hypothetical protein
MSADDVWCERGKDRTTHPLVALEPADSHRDMLIQLLLKVVAAPRPGQYAPP